MLTNLQADFITEGFLDISEPVSLKSDDCDDLLLKIQDSRKFDQSLFIDQPDDLGIIKHKGVNPRPDGNNLLLNLDTNFLEYNENLQTILNGVLGSYNIFLKKIICGLPDSCIPKWVIEIVKDKPVPNLGAYIKPQYQDITYFRGIDWHQDIIDFPQRDSRFITLYVYLHDVGYADAPLWVIPKSHLLGATTFPHRISVKSGNILKYSDDEQKNTLELKKQPLIGKTGSIYFWHSNVLHGTTQVNAASPRLSLRYLIEKDKNEKSIHPIDIVNTLALNNPSINTTRDDLDSEGKSLKSGNIIKGVI